MVGRADAVIDFIRAVAVVVLGENDLFERSDGFTEPRVQAEHPRYLVARGDGGRCSFRLRFDNIVGARVGQVGYGIDRNVFELRRGDLVFFARRRFNIQGIVIHGVALFQGYHHIVSADIDGQTFDLCTVRPIICEGVEIALCDGIVARETVALETVVLEGRYNAAARVGQPFARRIGDRYFERALADRELARHNFHIVVIQCERMADGNDIVGADIVARGVFLDAVYARPVPGGILFAENVLAVLVFESFDIEAVFLHVNFIAVDYGDVMDTQGKLRLADDVIRIFGGIVVVACLAAEAIVFVAQRDRNGIRACVDGRIRSRVPLSRIQPFDAQFIVIVANTVLTVEGDGSIPVCIAVGMRERVLVPIGIEHFGHDDIGAALRAAGKVIITPGGALLFQRRLYFVFADADRLHSDSEGSEAAAFALDKIFIGETEHIAVDKVRSEILRGNRDARIGQLGARGQVKTARKSELRDFERVRRDVKCKRVVRHLFDGGIHCNIVFADAAYARRIAGCGIGKFGYNAREHLFKVVAIDQAADEDIPCPAARRRAVDRRGADIRFERERCPGDRKFDRVGAVVIVPVRVNGNCQRIGARLRRPYDHIGRAALVEAAAAVRRTCKAEGDVFVGNFALGVRIRRLVVRRAVSPTGEGKIHVKLRLRDAEPKLCDRPRDFVLFFRTGRRLRSPFAPLVVVRIGQREGEPIVADVFRNAAEEPFDLPLRAAVFCRRLGNRGFPPVNLLLVIFVQAILRIGKNGDVDLELVDNKFNFSLGARIAVGADDFDDDLVIARIRRGTFRRHNPSRSLSDPAHYRCRLPARRQYLCPPFRGSP